MSDKEFQQHHTPKPCSFCGQAAGYAPVPAMERHGASVYFCHPCQAEYVYFDNTNYLSNTSLYTKINDKTYRWSVQSAGPAQIWHIAKPGAPGLFKNEGVSLVKSFNTNNGDVIPQLTPQNVNEKLRVWLVFL